MDVRMGCARQGAWRSAELGIRRNRRAGPTQPSRQMRKMVAGTWASTYFEIKDNNELDVCACATVSAVFYLRSIIKDDCSQV